MSKPVVNGIAYVCEGDDDWMDAENILDIISDISQRVLRGRKIRAIYVEYADDAAGGDDDED